MSGFVRTFALPAGFTPEQRDHLKRALSAVIAKQQSAAAATAAIVAARDFSVAGDALRIEYHATTRRTLSAALPGPEGAAQRWPEAVLIGWARQLCQAFVVGYPVGELPYLTHGGISPECVLWNDDDSLAIADFGVAGAYLSVPGGKAETRLEPIAAYVAPEVWRAPDQFTQQADIFAVGMILYQLATGAHAYGADAADPDQCRWQMMVELAVKPARWREDLSPELADLLYRMVVRAASERVRTFADAVDALELLAPFVDAPAPSERRADAAPTTATGTGTLAAAAEAEQRQRIETVRQREARLRAETLAQKRRQQHEEQRAADERSRQDEEHMRREAAELARRRQRSSERRAWLRRRAAYLAVGALVLLVLGGLGGGIWARARNDRLMDEADDGLRASWKEVVSKKQAKVDLGALGFAKPSAAVEKAIGMLQSAGLADKQMGVSIIREGLTHATGTLRITFGDPATLDLKVAIEGAERRVRIAQTAEEIDHLRQWVDGILNEKLVAERGKLMARLEGEVKQPVGWQELARRLAALGVADPAASLGWTAYRGEAKKFRMLKPGEISATDDRVEFELRISADDDPSRSWSPRGHVTIELGVESGIAALGIDSDEPLDHAQWCVERVTEPLRDAFTAGDAATLAQTLGVPTADAAAMFDWLKDCAPHELTFEALRDIQKPTTLAKLHYTVRWGAGGDATPAVRQTTVAFDRGAGWRLLPSAELISRVPPARVRAAHFVKRVAVDPADALGGHLGPGGPSRDELRSRIAQMQADGVTGFSVTDLTFEEADDASGGALSFHITPDGSKAWEGRALRFNVPADGEPALADAAAIVVWERPTETERFLTALRAGQAARWDLGKMEEALRPTLGAVAGDDARALRDWLTTVRRLTEGTNGCAFSPAENADWRRNLPDRVNLKCGGRAGWRFRLVVPDDGALPAYVMERELTTADWQALGMTPPADLEAFEAYFAEHGPRLLVDDAPAVTGVNFAAAGELAQRLGCQLPTAAEWRALHKLADSDGGGFDASPGGVVEWCRTDGGDPDPNTAEVVGSCWLEKDVQLPGDTRDLKERPDHGKQPKSRRDPTIGFRLACPLDVPRIIAESSPR